MSIAATLGDLFCGPHLRPWNLDTSSSAEHYALLLEICIVLTTQMWASDFAFKADNFCRGRMHYKFCPSPRADALQVLSLSEGRCITSFGSL